MVAADGLDIRAWRQQAVSSARMSLDNDGRSSVELYNRADLCRLATCILCITRRQVNHTDVMHDESIRAEGVPLCRLEYEVPV